MENGCEFRTVVHRKFVDLVRLLGLRVGLGIGATDEPEDRWYVPFGPERSEILAGGGRAGGPDTLGTEMPSECVHHSVGGFLIVHIQRVLIDGRDLWRPTRSRSR